MSTFALEKHQAVVVMRTGSYEQLVKIEAVDIESGKVTLDFDTSSRVSVHTLEDWEKLLAERRANNRPRSAERQQQNAPYMD
jgi:hypothetical protein